MLVTLIAYLRELFTGPVVPEPPRWHYCECGEMFIEKHKATCPSCQYMLPIENRRNFLLHTLSSLRLGTAGNENKYTNYPERRVGQPQRPTF
jgi:hypothetical protein